MSIKPNLNERYHSILKATIEHYIATAEPVGSKAIAQEYDFQISSATIRNVMGRLEAAGLLYQPHTSAGRIPSDFGYRLYVDHLLIPNESLGKKLEQSLQKQLPLERISSFEILIQRATKILSALSGYIALITFPQSPNDILRHLQLIQISSGQIMLIIVTDAYQTESILMESVALFTEKTKINQNSILEELQILSNFLNHKLKGQSLSKIAATNWQEIDQEFEHYADFMKVLSQEINRHFQPANETPIMMHGISEVLRQPEFSQLTQVQTLLYLLEEKQEQLWSVIFTLPNSQNKEKKVSIKIGSENPLEPMRTCSLVSANYYMDQTPVGSVGVIGPTRMLYDNTIALVETTADYLSDAFKA